MEKVLTVVIPAYNVEKYLDKNVSSLLDDDTNELIEILIVNDGSKDGTARIAKEYEDKYPGTVKLINKENGGHGSTINTGIANAAGKYFRVVDGDDWCDTEAFKQYVKALGKLDCDAALTPFCTVNINSGESVLKNIEYMESGRIYEFEEIILRNDNFYQMHSVTMKTDYLRAMRAIDENCFYVDVEYTIFPINALNTVVYLNEAVYQYRIGDSEQSVSIKSKQKNRSMHYKVISSLIDFYKNSELSENKRKFVTERIATMCNRQIEIYLSMDIGADTKKELLDFAEYVKGTAPEIYKAIPGKSAAILKGLGYGFYAPLAYFTNQKHKRSYR